MHMHCIIIQGHSLEYCLWNRAGLHGGTCAAGTLGLISACCTPYHARMHVHAHDISTEQGHPMCGRGCEQACQSQSTSSFWQTRLVAGAVLVSTPLLPQVD